MVRKRHTILKFIHQLKITIMRRRRGSTGRRRKGGYRKQKRSNKRYNSYRVSRGGVRL